MNEKDKKIRKQWVFLFVYSMVIAMASVFLQLRYDPTFDKFPFDTIPWVRYGIAAFSLLSTLIFGWIMYHCIYRKPGTKFLTFCLILAGISLVLTPILYLSDKIQPPLYMPYYGAYLILTQGMGIWWAIVFWKMRKINKRLKTLSNLSA